MDLHTKSNKVDVYDMTPSSDDSSNSSSEDPIEESQTFFEGNKPLVLELHDIKRTKDVSAKATAQETKPKKKFKKKKKIKEAKAKKDSTSTESDASLHLKEDTAQEEFYDAHESYHGIPPHQRLEKQVASPHAVGPTLSAAVPAVEASILRARSEEADQKPQVEITLSPSARALAAAKTAITKPV